jgi:protein-tyrosine-phosphatase
LTFLILFYGALIVLGGIVLYAINSRAGKNVEEEEQAGTAEVPSQKEAPQNNESPAKKVTGKETDSSGYTMTDDEYREALRRSLKKQTDTETKEEPPRDPDRYSDQEYREVLRSMHKQLNQDKESNR